MSETAPSLENWLTHDAPPPPAGTRLVGLDPLAKALTLAAVFEKNARCSLAVFASRSEARDAIDNFRFFAGTGSSSRVHYLPSVEFDYYRGLLPNPEILCDRNVALFHALNDPGHRLFVTTASALLQKTFPPAEYLRATRVLSPNQEVDREELIRGMMEAGYQRQPAAYDPGVFSVRGGVIDVFCPLYPNPLRVEFFGDLIEELRFFEPQSQRSLDKIEKAFLIPVGQTLVPHGQEFEEASMRVKERLDNLGIPKSRREEILEGVQNGQVSSEMGFLFPLLSRGSTPLLDFFPADTLLWWDGREKIQATALETELPKFLKSVELFEKEPLPIADHRDLFLQSEEVRSLIHRPQSYSFEDFSTGAANEVTVTSDGLHLEQERKETKRSGTSHSVLDGFARRFRDWMDQGYRIQLVCHTQTHAERVQMLLEPYGLRARLLPETWAAWPACLQTTFEELNLWRGHITQSRMYPILKLIVMSEEEIFGQKKRVAAPARSAAWNNTTDPSRLLSSFRDLRVNDLVVHRDQGIGRYLGLRSMEVQGVTGDFVVVEYRDGDKLYVPVYRLNVLQKYVGGEGAAGVSLDKMGGDRWTKAKQKASAAVAELAAEFLKIQAKRKLIPAFAFSEPSQDYHQFSMEFPFDETPDQSKSIDDVMADLSRANPMDRLICGDVGYGKTEVAMRGAYRAVLDGKQVAVLVPTTVLAFQHYETFKRRFKSTAARIEMVSRLRSNTESKKVLAEVKDGKVDILIGTHRLLSADVQFKDLGLAIVDEEHRFGVAHKEKIKKMTESVHLVSMTATPIPRTLNMAMTGIKDISIITTPPPDRLAVRTFVCRRNDEVIIEAVTNELAREGQVFFVHNRIETIQKLADELHRLLPKVKIEVAHGQMEGEVLEKKMLAFYQNEFQILLTTAIIESGLDIPRANTILIDQAHYFGLAQLYQLRGRVGRSEKRAYCYLLVPSENEITEEAKQRLQVIQRYTDLGSGFNIASHDLEIRGAGDLLGKDQSGHLSAIGVDMYFELLEESIRELQGQEKKIEIEPEITLKLAAYFPENYLPDISERIQLYRRLSSVETEDQVADIESEIRDRFGTPTAEVVNLIGLMKIKLHLKRLHVVRMSCGPKRTSLQFAATTPASPEKLVRLIQSHPGHYTLTPDQKFVFPAEDQDWRVLLREIQRLSHQIVPEA